MNIIRRFLPKTAENTENIKPQQPQASDSVTKGSSDAYSRERSSTSTTKTNAGASPKDLPQAEVRLNEQSRYVKKWTEQLEAADVRTQQQVTQKIEREFVELTGEKPNSSNLYRLLVDNEVNKDVASKFQKIMEQKGPGAPPTGGLLTDTRPQVESGRQRLESMAAGAEVETVSNFFREHMPSTRKQVLEAAPDEYVTLWRGGEKTNFESMKTFGSVASGMKPNLNAPPPSEEAAKSQAAGKQGKADAVSLPEFTTMPEKAVGFGRASGGVIAVSIQRKYLTEGSPAEGGWVVDPSAPVKAWGFCPMQRVMTARLKVE